jgi:hypothetical protein
MTKREKLKLVVRYDARRNQYTVWDHNLTEEQVLPENSRALRQSVFNLYRGSAERASSQTNRGLSCLPQRCRARITNPTQTKIREEEHVTAQPDVAPAKSTVPTAREQWRCGTR